MSCVGEEMEIEDDGRFTEDDFSDEEHDVNYEEPTSVRCSHKPMLSPKPLTISPPPPRECAPRLPQKNMHSPFAPKNRALPQPPFSVPLTTRNGTHSANSTPKINMKDRIQFLEHSLGSCSNNAASNPRTPPFISPGHNSRTPPFVSPVHNPHTPPFALPEHDSRTSPSALPSTRKPSLPTKPPAVPPKSAHLMKSKSSDAGIGLAHLSLPTFSTPPPPPVRRSSEDDQINRNEKPLPPVAKIPPIPHIFNANNNGVSLSTIYLEKFPWYHGNISRVEAEIKLSKVNGNGRFLIREKMGKLHNRPFALSLLFHNKIYHLEIRNESGKYAVGCGPKPDEKVFDGVDALVSYYRDNRLHLISRTHSPSNNAISCSTILAQCVLK